MSARPGTDPKTMGFRPRILTHLLQLACLAGPGHATLAFAGPADPACVHDNLSRSAGYMKDHFYAGRPVTDYKIGETYQLHPSGTSRVRKVEFLGARVDDQGGRWLIFRKPKDKRASRRKTFGLDEVFVYRDANPSTPASTFAGLSSAGAAAKLLARPARVASDIAIDTFGFRRAIARGSRVAVSGAGSPSADAIKAAHDFVRSIEDFDAKLEAGGFRIPRSTHVQIRETEGVTTTGPSAIATAGMSLSARGPYFRITMEPFGQKPFLPSAAFDTSTLLHERTHTLLSANYSLRSHVNANTSLNEALADYFSYDHLGIPHDPIGVSHPTLPVRDIRNRTQAGNAGMGMLNDITQLDEAHFNSLLYSNTLWKLREKIGTEAAFGLLRPLIDHLNSHAASFKKMPLWKQASKTDREVLNFEYFLAMLRKTSKGTEHEAAVQTVIDAQIAEFRLDPRRPGRILDRVRSDGKPHEANVFLQGAVTTAAIGMIVVPTGKFAVETLIRVYEGWSDPPAPETRLPAGSNPPWPGPASGMGLMPGPLPSSVR